MDLYVIYLFFFSFWSPQENLFCQSGFVAVAVAAPAVAYAVAIAVSIGTHGQLLDVIILLMLSWNPYIHMEDVGMHLSVQASNC